ncbi:hypothetical protein ACSBR1_012428 [Camellia fascicularis]
MVVAAREGCKRLQAMSLQDRSKILLSIADALEENEKLITIENEADVGAARLASYEQSLIARLALKPGKISSLANSIRVLANMEEPIGRVLKKTQIVDGFLLEKTSSPLGVLLIIFESRPEALVQVFLGLFDRRVSFFWTKQNSLLVLSIPISCSLQGV